MLLLGRLFGCEDEMLTIVALMMCPKLLWNDRERSDDLKAFYSKIDQLSGPQLSDHILQLNLYQEWSLRFDCSFESGRNQKKMKISAERWAEQKEWCREHNVTQGFMNEVASIRTNLKRKLEKTKKSVFEVQHVTEGLNLRIKMCLAASSPFLICQVTSVSSLPELIAGEMPPNFQASNSVEVSTPDIHRLLQKVSEEFTTINQNEIWRILKQELKFVAECIYGRVSKVIIEVKSAFIEFEEGVAAQIIKEMRQNMRMSFGRNSFASMYNRGYYEQKTVFAKGKQVGVMREEEFDHEELRLRIRSYLSSEPLTLTPLETIAMTNTVTGSELRPDPTSVASLLNSDSLKCLAQIDGRLMQQLASHYRQRALMQAKTEAVREESEEWMEASATVSDMESTYAIYSQATGSRALVAQCTVLPAWAGVVQLVLLVFAPHLYLEIGNMNAVEKLQFCEGREFRITHWMDKSDLAAINSIRTALRKFYWQGVADTCVWDSLLDLMMRKRPPFVDFNEGFEGFIQSTKVTTNKQE